MLSVSPMPLMPFGLWHKVTCKVNLVVEALRIMVGRCFSYSISVRTVVASATLSVKRVDVRWRAK